MSTLVKNKDTKRYKAKVAVKVVITLILLFFAQYLCSHFMEYQKNATNQVNKYRIDQVCQLTEGTKVTQKFIAKHKWVCFAINFWVTFVPSVN